MPTAWTRVQGVGTSRVLYAALARRPLFISTNLLVDLIELRNTFQMIPINCMKSFRKLPETAEN